MTNIPCESVRSVLFFHVQHCLEGHHHQAATRIQKAAKRSMEAYLEQISDQVLSSEAGLLRLYAVKARTDAAASRRRHLPLDRRGLMSRAH